MRDLISKDNLKGWLAPEEDFWLHTCARAPGQRQTDTQIFFVPLYVRLFLSFLFKERAF